MIITGRRYIMRLNEPAFYNSPEPRPLRYSRSVCRSDSLRRGAGDSWFWIGRPFALTSRLVPVGHKTRGSDILTSLRKEVVHICSFNFTRNMWEWCAAVNMSLKYSVIWWKETTLTLNMDCETIDRLSVACHSQRKQSDANHWAIYITSFKNWWCGHGSAKEF